MLSVTPTKLSDYLTCPHKYKLKHINKAEAIAFSAALSFGRTMHSALQELHRSGENSSEFEISELLSRFWESNAYSGAGEGESYFIKGCEALQTYCKSLDYFEGKTIGTEIYLSYVLKFGNLQTRLGCKADRICLHSDNVLEVIDYKTNSSGRVPTLEFLQSDLPTFLYYVLARVAYPEYRQVHVSLLNILTLAKVSVNYNTEQITANKQALSECLKAFAVSDFSPISSEACSWCFFQDECPAFSKVIDFASII